jgi:hypothetical protein
MNVREPNQKVALGADALGVVGEATGHAVLGYAGSALSLANDPSVQNAVMTGTAFVPVVGEAVGAVGVVSDVGTSVGNFITNHIEAPMFNAAPTQNIDDGNGHMIPNPALADPRDLN